MGAARNIFTEFTGFKYNIGTFDANQFAQAVYDELRSAGYGVTGVTVASDNVISNTIWNLPGLGSGLFPERFRIKISMSDHSEDSLANIQIALLRYLGLYFSDVQTQKFATDGNQGYTAPAPTPPQQAQPTQTQNNSANSNNDWNPLCFINPALCGLATGDPLGSSNPKNDVIPDKFNPFAKWDTWSLGTFGITTPTLILVGVVAALVIPPLLAPKR